MKRRDFLQTTTAATGIAIGSMVPQGWMHSLASELHQDSSGSQRVLVIIQLTGGNDGLNTIIPHRHDAYRKARPKIGIESKDVLKLNDEFGMHPSLVSLQGLIDAQRFSIVQGVGYDKPNRSHFESMDIWHSCQHKVGTQRNGSTRSGWLGRLFQLENFQEQKDAPGLHLGSEPLPLAMIEKGVQIPSIASLDQFRWKQDRRDTSSAVESNQMDRSAIDGNDPDDLLSFVSASTEAALQASQRIESALKQPDAPSDFPSTPLGEKLRIVARLIMAGLKTSVYYVTLDGFDTHANQLAAHAGLLRQWSDALSAFHERVRQDGQSDRVLTMTFSEFGRRVSENASLGTDHGAAAPMFSLDLLCQN